MVNNWVMVQKKISLGKVYPLNQPQVRTRRGEKGKQPLIKGVDLVSKPAASTGHPTFSNFEVSLPLFTIFIRLFHKKVDLRIKCNTAVVN